MAPSCSPPCVTPANSVSLIPDRDNLVPEPTIPELCDSRAARRSGNQSEFGGNFSPQFVADPAIPSAATLSLRGSSAGATPRYLSTHSTATSVFPHLQYIVVAATTTTAPKSTSIAWKEDQSTYAHLPYGRCRGKA